MQQPCIRESLDPAEVNKLLSYSSPPSFAHCCLRIDLGLLFLTDFLLVRGVAYVILIDCDGIVGLIVAVCWLV